MEELLKFKSKIYPMNEIIFPPQDDIYFLTYSNGKIIVNDDYRGIRIFLKDLTAYRDIGLFPGIIIKYIYKNFLSPHLIVLYCPENNAVIPVNLETLFWESIFLPDSLKDGITFPSLYFWISPSALLIPAYNDALIFYMIDLVRKKISVLDTRIVEYSFLSFYKFCVLIQQQINNNLNIYGICSNSYSFIVDNEDGCFSYVNALSNIQITLNYYSNAVHDIVYKNEVFVFLIEDFVIFENKKKIIAQIAAFRERRFLRASFLDTHSITLLSDSLSNYECLLNLYTIERFL